MPDELLDRVEKPPMSGVGVEPQATSLVLTFCIVAAIVLLMVIEPSPVAYVAAASLLGAGYGLT